MSTYTLVNKYLMVPNFQEQIFSEEEFSILSLLKLFANSIYPYFASTVLTVRLFVVVLPKLLVISFLIHKKKVIRSLINSISSTHTD